MTHAATPDSDQSYIRPQGTQFDLGLFDLKSISFDPESRSCLRWLILTHAATPAFQTRSIASARSGSSLRRARASIRMGLSSMVRWLSRTHATISWPAGFAHTVMGVPLQPCQRRKRGRSNSLLRTLDRDQSVQMRFIEMV